MTEATGLPRTIAGAMDDVAKWRSSAVNKNRSEIQDVDTEIENLRKAVANLQQQIEALRRSREDIVKREDKLAEEEVSKSYTAVFAALAEQSAALTKRSAAMSELASARKRAVEAAYADPAIAATVAEYNAFKTTVAPTLASFPERLRTIMLAEQAGTEKKLREHLEAAMRNSKAEVAGDPLAVEVVFAVDPAEGAPEVVMLVLPVAETVFTEWSTRAEDVQTQIAARVIEAVYRTATAAGLGNARAAFGGHAGLLAVEMEIAGAKGDFAGKLGEELGRVLGSASELQAAKVQVRAVNIPVDHLLPPEEAEGNHA
jgi:uncharacterized protein YoxC